MMTSREKVLVQLALAKQFWAAPEADDVLPLHDEDGRLDDLESDAESEHGDHATHSEHSAEESAPESDNDDRRTSASEIAIGRGEKTRWAVSNASASRGRDIPQLPGVPEVAKNAKTRLECWRLFFPDHIIEHIVKCTNIYLGKLRPSYGRGRDCRETDPAEMFALVGLLYMAGVQKSQHLNVKELWSTDGSAPECFRATMSKERFLLLLRALRFDDISTRNERKALDNLAPIREVFEDFNGRCRNSYLPGEYLTAGEVLETLRGRCKFRQHIGKKPAKYGIKRYSLVDARFFYTLNMEIYAGKQPDGPYKCDNSAHSVVMRLARPILGTGRNITTDSRFTSLPLAAELLENGTTVVGTIRKSGQLPKEWLELRVGERCCCKFGFSEIQKGVLVSYKPKSSNRKNFLCFSTLHDGDKIDETTNEPETPEIVTFYDATKGGVDVAHRMASNYSVSRVSGRWPLTTFFSLLNVAGVNCQIIYNLNTNTIEERRLFLKSLALELIKPQLVSRSQLATMPVLERHKMKRIAGVEEENPTSSGSRIPSQFCAYCPRRKNKKSKRSCRKCKRTVCNEHSFVVCHCCGEEHFT